MGRWGIAGPADGVNKASHRFCQSLVYPTQANCSLDLLFLSLQTALKSAWLQFWVAAKLYVQLLYLELLLKLVQSLTEHKGTHMLVGLSAVSNQIEHCVSFRKI